MRQEKKYHVLAIEDQIKEQESFLVMQYSGMSANVWNDLRSRLDKLGGGVAVVPKRLFVRASESVGVSLDLKALQGHIGLVFGGQDPILTTKFVYDFSKENDKAIQVLCGRFDGQMYSREDVKKLSQLPGKDAMRVQFLGLLEAPMGETLAVMEALLTGVVHCLEQKGQNEKS